VAEKKKTKGGLCLHVKPGASVDLLKSRKLNKIRGTRGTYSKNNSDPQSPKKRCLGPQNGPESLGLVKKLPKRKL
jgi:hypothetical protein